jgi:hypothetical protein
MDIVYSGKIIVLNKVVKADKLTVPESAAATLMCNSGEIFINFSEHDLENLKKFIESYEKSNIVQKTVWKI